VTFGVSGEDERSGVPLARLSRSSEEKIRQEQAADGDEKCRVIGFRRIAGRTPRVPFDRGAHEVPVSIESPLASLPVPVDEGTVPP
jgi:hypothetical protein